MSVLGLGEPIWGRQRYVVVVEDILSIQADFPLLLFRTTDVRHNPNCEAPELVILNTTLGGQCDGALTAKASFHMPVIEKAGHDCQTKSRRRDIDLSPLYKSSEPPERFILLTLPFRTVILFILTWPNQPRNPRVGWADGLLMCAAYYSSEITVGPLSHSQKPPSFIPKIQGAQAGQE